MTAEIIRQQVRAGRLARGLIVTWTRRDNGKVEENSYSSDAERDAFLAWAKRNDIVAKIATE